MVIKIMNKNQLKLKKGLTENELSYIDEYGHWAGTVNDHPDNCYVQLEFEFDEEEDDEN